jgi:hypothetical protein
MDLAKFVSLLSSQSLYFACPNEFHDPYEGLYPKSQVAAFSSMAQAQIDQAKLTRDKIIEQRPGVNVERLNDTVQILADSLRRGFNEVRLKFGITCWHKNQVESEAMWKLYSAAGQGIAVESTRGRLTDSILEKEHLVIDDVYGTQTLKPTQSKKGTSIMDYSRREDPLTMKESYAEPFCSRSRAKEHS